MTVNRRMRANALRMLAVDAVQAANSGHPGMPMGMADIAEVLWNDFLRHNPCNPRWPNRDRFVLSNGHGSMLLYALLHLTGYDLPIEELINFRQLGSRTPGHPEYGETPGVETTTGPLGQGLANAVGMALAERTLAAQFNRPRLTLVDHFTYVFLGDGCLMEGISHEACSLAGTLGLGKLICFYDDNGISIDGDVRGWFTDDTPARFGAYGWQVLEDVDGHDPKAIRAAIEQARFDTRRPTLICCKTVIGWGSPAKAGSAGCHGAPLGADEVTAVRERLDWPSEAFDIPQAIRCSWSARAAGKAAEREWQACLDELREREPETAAEFERRMHGVLPATWQEQAATFVRTTQQSAQSLATRKSSEQALDAYAPLLPELVGGSADLTGSNLTRHGKARTNDVGQPDGNYVYFGVREFAMAAICSGMALHGGFIPFAATFLMFSEYARNAIRMAALMKLRSVFVFTHDSIGLGEDGPTHQAVEQAATLRLMPGMSVWRPCDAVETAVAWKAAIERADGPTCLLLSRQSLVHQPRTDAQVAAIARGGYVLEDCQGEPEIVLLATGSEVPLAVDAAQVLQDRGHRARVVSLPSSDVFDAQPTEYRNAVLPDTVRARIAIEAGVSDWWRKYVGLDGDVVGIDAFGQSAPAGELFAHFGFTVERVVARADSLLARARQETAETA